MCIRDRCPGNQFIGRYITTHASIRFLSGHIVDRRTGSRCMTDDTEVEMCIRDRRTYDLNLTRYREGDITGMDMNQFQTQLSNKKIAYTQALINYKIELLNLKILSLYDFEHDMPIVPMEDLVTKK